MTAEKNKTINWGRVIFVVVLVVVLFFSSNVFYKPVQKSARTSTRSRMLALHTALLQYREGEGVFPSGTDKEIISTLITRRKEYRKGKHYVYMESRCHIKTFSVNTAPIPHWMEKGVILMLGVLR